MGKIKINETASEPMTKNGSNNDIDTSERIMPIEHYVTVSAKVENKDNVSVEGVKSAPKKSGAKASGASTGKRIVNKSSTAVAKKKALALPAGSIGAAVIDEKEKAGTASAAKNATKKSSAKLAMDGMVKPKPRTVEVTEIEPTAEEEFEAHRPREKKEEEPEEEKNPRFSKPKAALIAVGVALVVAIIGGVVIALTGHKEPERCVVQFESNGGSKIESEEVVCGETIARPGDPTKEGFAFQNWIYGGSPFDFEGMTIDEDIILVAKWQVEEGTEVVKVHFDTDGGSEIEDIEVKKGGVISAPVDPTRTSYEFAGWKLGDEDFDFSQPIDEDITLVAQWTAVAGGSGSSSTGGSSNKPAEKPNVESLAVGDVSMKVGDTKMIDLTLKPSNAKYQLGVSVDGNIATCTVEDGPRLKCVGKGAGETTAILRDNLTGKSTQFKVTVSADVTYVELSSRSLALTSGASTTLTVKVTSSGDAGTPKWTSSNPNVATVDANGKVTAVGVGEARITVTVGGMSDSCNVKVSAPVDPTPTPDPEPEKPDPGTEEPDPDTEGAD
jgi:hypothetical protein